MQMPVFITGNQHKADFLAKWLGIDLTHQKLELDELQSLDLHEIVEHKTRQAYRALGRPVLVEDVGFVFHTLGGLPGPFIKWFLQELSLQQICDLVKGHEDRSATSMVCYGLFDGTTIHFFDGSLNGVVAPSPKGDNGFGFDSIFIPDGSQLTHGEMDDADLAKFGLRTTTVYPQLRDFLQIVDK